MMMQEEAVVTHAHLIHVDGSWQWRVTDGRWEAIGQDLEDTVAQFSKVSGLRVVATNLLMTKERLA
jgi:hypothetical protein